MSMDGHARYRLWPAGARWPLGRLALGIALAPVAATAATWAIAFVIAGMGEATIIGVRAVAENAARTYAVFAATLVVFAIAPAIAILWLLGRRGRLAWILAGLMAGGAAASVLALDRGAGLMPAVPIGAVSALLMIMVVRWIAGIRRDREAD